MLITKLEFFYPSVFCRTEIWLQMLAFEQMLCMFEIVSLNSFFQVCVNGHFSIKIGLEESGIDHFFFP